jgi:signal recognition particle subunit SRP54
MEFARKEGCDVVIIDTAGRLHIDEELMAELKNIKSSVRPMETLLVVDAMTGQDAVNVAESFNSTLDITGVILTKLDGDTRGGAALSIREVIGKPIKFSGIGEKMSDLEVFHPERMASRILGMGDVLTLIEKAQTAISEKEAKELGSKMMSKEFNFEDYLKAFEQMQKLGPLNKIMEMIPGMGSKELKGVNLDDSEKEMMKTKSIIHSMTFKERKNPKLLDNASRKKRIAKGSGTTIQDVNKLIKGFEGMKKMMKQMGSMQKGSKKGMFGKLPF